MSRIDEIRRLIRRGELNNVLYGPSEFSSDSSFAPHSMVQSLTNPQPQRKRKLRVVIKKKGRGRREIIVKNDYEDNNEDNDNLVTNWKEKKVYFKDFQRDKMLEDAAKSDSDSDEESRKRKRIWQGPTEITEESHNLDSVIDSLRDEKKNWKRENKYGKKSHENFEDYIEMMLKFNHQLRKQSDNNSLDF